MPEAPGASSGRRAVIVADDGCTHRSRWIARRGSDRWWLSKRSARDERNWREEIQCNALIDRGIWMGAASARGGERSPPTPGLARYASQATNSSSPSSGIICAYCERWDPSWRPLGDDGLEPGCPSTIDARSTFQVVRHCFKGQRLANASGIRIAGGDIYCGEPDWTAESAKARTPRDSPRRWPLADCRGVVCSQDRYINVI